VLERRTFDSSLPMPLVIEGLEKFLRPGTNTIHLHGPESVEIPYVLQLAYHTHQPQNCEPATLRLAARLAERRIKRGQTTNLTIELANTSGENIKGVVAVIGLPAGLHAPQRALAALQQAGEIHCHELRGRQLICGWRELKVGQQVRFSLELIAEVAGEFVGPPSFVYPYSEPHDCWWETPLQCRIVP